MREAARCVELCAKLSGELSDAPIINVLALPAVSQFQAGLLQLLKPYPELKLGAVRLLEGLVAP